jgi:iron-sulfur cluster repair protein YtfE (RIC family)
VGVISEFMSRDHDRLDVFLAELCTKPAAARARELFARFDADLRAHIAWEEDILFPAFEEKTGMRQVGPTAVMRMEHAQIDQLLQDLKLALETPTSSDAAQALVEVLSAHNGKEENVLYPALDSWLRDDEAAALLERIERSAGASLA